MNVSNIFKSPKVKKRIRYCIWIKEDDAVERGEWIRTQLTEEQLAEYIKNKLKAPAEFRIEVVG